MWAGAGALQARPRVARVPNLTTVSRPSLSCVALAAGAESPRQSHWKPCTQPGSQKGCVDAHWALGEVRDQLQWNSCLACTASSDRQANLPPILPAHSL